MILLSGSPDASERLVAGSAGELDALDDTSRCSGGTNGINDYAWTWTPGH